MAAQLNAGAEEQGSPNIAVPDMDDSTRQQQHQRRDADEATRSEIIAPARTV